jgi:tetratricopeptide (TPR) repeat protein
MRTSRRWLSGLLPLDPGKKLLRQLENADQNAVSGNYSRSKNGYRNIIRSLEQLQDKTPEEIQLLGRVYFGLGQVELAEHDENAAFHSFTRADSNGCALSDPALIVLAEGYARENRKESAVNHYLRYISIRRQPYGPAEKVYALLESCCYIDERSDPARVSDFIALNREVITANSDIDWAYHYTGMCYFLTGDFTNAEQYFQHAMTRNPFWKSRQYYLGRAYLGAGNLDEALTTLRVAAAKEPGNADASFLVGKILITQFEKEACRT